MAKKPTVSTKPAAEKAEKIALAAIANEGDTAVVTKPPKAKPISKAKPQPTKETTDAPWEEPTKPAVNVMQKMSQAEIAKLSPEKKPVPITPTGKLDFTACKTPMPGVGPATPIDPNIEILSQYLKK